MKRFFFLPPVLSYSLIFGIIFFLWNFPFGFYLPLVILFSLFLFVSRRSLIPYRDTLKNDGEIYLSPIHGKIDSVRYRINQPDYPSPCHEIRINLSFWNEKGLYLPTSGEVSYLKAIEGKKLHRNFPLHLLYEFSEDLSHTDLRLTSKNEITSLLRFFDSAFGVRPNIWLKYGDRGKAGACFGHYSFGGTLIIYLPESADILVFEGETVIPGQSVLAVLKDEAKVKL